MQADWNTLVKYENHTNIQPAGGAGFFMFARSKRPVCRSEVSCVSLEALTWAFKQEVFPSSRKFVLVVLSNFASESGKSYPSIGTVASYTGLTDDTIMAALEGLITSGLITDTGQRTGNTRKIRVFQLACGTVGSLTQYPKNSGIKYPRNNLEIPEKYPNPPESPNIQGTGTGTGTIVRAKAPRTPVFVPPELTECIQYGSEIGMGADEAEAFRDRFMSNGWKVGGRAPMKDWKAAMRTWKRNAHQFTNGKPDVKPNYERTEREGKF